jgi:anti-anti-sigma factor
MTDDSPGDTIFTVQEHHLDGLVVLEVHGDLDAVTSPRLTEAINASLGSEPAALVVDLSELDFLASAGMTALLVGHTAAGESTRFGVVANGPTTSRPMELVGLHTELNLYPTMDAARVAVNRE